MTVMSSGRRTSFLHFAVRSLGVPIVLAMFFFLTSVQPEAEGNRRTTHDGISLQEPIRIRLADLMLHVPAGYLVPWPTPAMRERINAMSSLNFSFWMPDKRAPETSPMSRLGFRPIERGRDAPQANQFLVSISDMKVLGADKIGTRSPEVRFDNLISRSGPASYSFKKEEFELIRFWRHDWPYPQPEPYLNYVSERGADPQILLRCTPSHRNLDNPVCDGYAYLLSERLSFYVIFSLGDLPRWRESIDAARDLFERWRISP